ncbi:MAG: 8-oxo-dGTP diphosphatase [Caldilineaceae bacterium]|nr:8-oxo-dGTP diphosphatase [Caldilineaceae bacterium]
MITQPSFPREGTVCYPIDQVRQRLLLGMKKRGAGVGRYNGFGGKIERGETPAEAAARELWEESGLMVHADSLLSMGHVHFPHVEQRMHVFVATAWDGLLIESDEMCPQWFSLTALPYEQMWPTDRDWLPHVLAGRQIAVVVHLHTDGRRTSVVQLVE